MIVIFYLNESKGLSDESIKPPITSEKMLNPSVD